MQIETSARAGEEVGIGLLVERVGSDRESRALARRREGLYLEVILVEVAKHTVTTATGEGADGCTLEDLTHMEGESLVEALRDSEAGEDSGVVGATSHDHLGTALESLHKGLLTHLSDDVD